MDEGLTRDEAKEERKVEDEERKNGRKTANN